MASNQLDPSSQRSLRDYLAIAHRRRSAIILALVLVPVIALLSSFRQETLYEASAQVLLNFQTPAGQVTESQDSSVNQEAERLTETQAILAASPPVASRTMTAAGIRDESVADFLARTSVTARQSADLLLFTVRDESERGAIQIANRYAHEFTRYRRELDTISIRRAAAQAQERLASLSKDERGSSIGRRLQEDLDQLRTLQALQTSNAFVVQGVDTADRVQPRPVRNAIFGLVLGSLLAAVLALVWEALDTKVRKSDEITDILRLPLLGRVAPPPRDLATSDRLLMINRPAAFEAEAFRLLRTNLQFANLSHQARVIMITSATQTEGKSTTISNLAVTLARGGDHVVLVDLDLRRPSAHRLLASPSIPGLTDVVLGQARLDDALTAIQLEQQIPATEAPHISSLGELEFLPCGTQPLDVGDFVDSEALDMTLQALSARADVVLIDAPPMLGVSDTLALSRRVDAVIVASRINTVRRPMLHELRRLLDLSPAAKLGLIVNGEEAAQGYYGAGYRYATTEGKRVAEGAS